MILYAGLAVALAGCVASTNCLAASKQPARDLSIGSSFKGEPITLSLSPRRFAGAVTSLRYRGVEYVDLADHGRQIQSALQIDGFGECYNPTEAGSKLDGPGTSSQLLFISATGSSITTRTRAAFWLAPHEDYHGYCSGSTPALGHYARAAQNSQILSNFVVEKHTRFDAGIPNLIVTDTIWHFPEKHASASIESLTGYLPHSFANFLVYDSQTRTLTVKTPGSVDNAAQHTIQAVIIADVGGYDAVGAFAPAIMSDPSKGYIAFYDFAGIGTPTTKWSCVFHIHTIEAGPGPTQQCISAIGTVDEVIGAIDSYRARGRQSSTMMPVYRSYKAPLHRMALSYANATGDGFTFEMTAFKAFRTGGVGRRPIYLCRDHGRTDLVDDTGTCVPAARQPAGYVAIGPANSLVPLHRFRHPVNGDILLSIDDSEGRRNGYRDAGVVGYVMP